MSRLFKLKEWLTLEEASAHISSVLGEPATIADLHRFSLDGHLTLSVDFVNKTYVRKGKWVKTDDVEFELMENVFNIEVHGKKLEIPFSVPTNYEIRVSEDDWIALDKPVVSIEGVWDVVMFGGGKLDIEHNYQQLTSGLEVTLVAIDGAFVQQGDAVCQLQVSFDDNEYQKGSKAQEKEMESYIAINHVSENDAKELREKFKVDREKYLKERINKPREDDYYPAGGLPENSTLVVRTKEVTRFIQSLEDNSKPEKPLTSKERNSLLVLIGAFCKEVNIDPNKRGVSASLVAMTEILGAPLTDDTIRKILSQVKEAVELRSK